MWYLTFENQPELTERAKRAQACLRGVETVDLVPLLWLHLTLDDVGFVDEISPAQVDDVVESARADTADWKVPWITLGPVTTMEDAIVLRAAPEDELKAWRDRLRATTSRVLHAGAVAAHPYDFPPHVTLAYSNDACDRRTVMEPLAALPADQFVIAPPQVTLAAVTRRDRHYQWTVRASLALGDSTST
jgi:2'-5' RNA ligase